jgi:peptidyl-prolyl cis-trans isomerase SurA
MVNDEPRLASDVEQLYLFLQRAGRPDSSQVDAAPPGADQLIDEKLVLAEASAEPHRPPAEVQKRVEAAINGAKRATTARRASGQLAGNTTEARLRERYKTDVEKQMLEKRLVDRVIPRKKVGQVEAEAYFVAHKDKFPKVPPQLHMQVIQITPSPDSLALRAGKARIDSVRKRLQAGDSSRSWPPTSDDPGTAKSGGDLGFFRHGQMERSRTRRSRWRPLDIWRRSRHRTAGT